MHPRMSDQEIRLFDSFIRNSQRYVEFGAGGSTVYASRFVSRSIISVDSSTEWLSKVEAGCAGFEADLTLMHADIGATGDWGYPTDPNTRMRWPSYHTGLWQNPAASQADLYFIDGRFRVACFAQALLHGGANAVLGIHDFTSRPHYHCVREVAREIATAEDISFFIPIPNVGERINGILRHHWLVAD